jgi:hypothetical protein
MAQFRTDKHGIVRDSTSIYWFTGLPTSGTKCDVYESDKGMFAVVKEPNNRPELWEYRYGSSANGGWDYVRAYKQAHTARVGMLRYEKRLVVTQ